VTFSRRFGIGLTLSLTLAILAIHHPRAAQDIPRQKIIVELAAPAPVVVEADRAVREGRSFDATAHERAVLEAQDRFLSALNASGIAYTVTTTTLALASGPFVQTNRFTYLINAVGIEVAAAVVGTVAAMPGVAHVTADESLRPMLDQSVKYIGASAGPGNKTIFTQGGGPLTRFDGAGQVIAVLDTGIEHTHPMFDARFPDSQFTSRVGDARPVRLGGQPYVAGVNHAKVIYSLTLTAATQEDDAGHGTHAAADAAGMMVRAPGPDRIPGTADDKIIEGVAPGALLMSYKICETAFTCVGTVAGLVIALEDAVRTSDPLGFPKPVATVLNMSFGGGGSPNDASAVAASNAALAGAVAVASAGNSGRAGENTVGAPSAGRRVISVGATNDPGVPSLTDLDVVVPDPARYTNALGSTGAQNDAGRPRAPEDRAIIANLSDPSPAVAFPLGQHYVYVGLADTPDQVPDAVRGRIALAVRGSTVDASATGSGLFAHKSAEVTAKGGVALIVINNIDGELTGVTSIASGIPVYGISKVNGEYLRDTLGFEGAFNKDDRNTWGVISKFPIRITPSTTFTPSTTAFSSRGPVDNFQFVKPDVTAPGQSIYAATIVVGGAQVSTNPPGVAPLPMADPSRYVSASGTSFSGPQVAGAAALVRQAMLEGRGHVPIAPSDLRNGGGAAMQRFQNTVAPQSLVRAALTNTATNLREADGETPVPDADRRSFIHEIGGGLVHVRLAVDARAAMGTNIMNGGGGPDSAEDPNFIPTHSFGARQVIDTGNPAQTVSVAVTLQNIVGPAGAGTYSLSVVDGGALHGTVSRPIAGTTGFSVSLGADSVTLGGAMNDRVSIPVTVTVDGRPAPEGLALAGADSTGAQATEFLWWVVARGSNGAVLRMPFYYRAVKTAVAGGTVPNTPASLGPIQDDADPDWINGVDQDGNYRLSWTYDNNPNLEQPCAFVIEEASAFSTTFTDAAEELIVAGSNSTWSGAVQWHSRPHPTTGTSGYSVLYIDNLNASFTTRAAVPIPVGGRTVLSFDSWEDIEPGFDFGRVEAAGENGVFQTLAVYDGLFAGQRVVDLTPFAGQSAKLRFRFTTDLLVSAPFHGGWFIDNIRVQSADFGQIAVVDGSVRSYDVRGKFDGTYTYRIVPMFGENCDQRGSSSNVQQITVSSRGQAADPVSDFTAAPNPAQAGQAVTFDASASRDGDESGCCIQQYFWAFGDGSTTTTSTPTTTHAYQSPGSYRVVLTVTDNEGKSASSEQFVQVSDPPRAGEAEGGGWIAAPSGDRGHFTFDVQTDGATAAGTMSYTDRGAKLKAEALTIESLTFDGTTARITGTCTVNKAASFTFTIDVADGGDPGKGRDAFAIRLSNGYQASGTLGGGNVAVR
jgi:PKD repeat protein